MNEKISLAPSHKAKVQMSMYAVWKVVQFGTKEEGNGKSNISGKHFEGVNVCPGTDVKYISYSICPA